MIKVALLLTAVLLVFLIQNLKAQTISSLEIERLINLKAMEWGVDSALVKAVVKVESNFNVRAKNPLDPSYGLMQITPILAQDFGYVKNWRSPSNAEIENLYNPSTNLDIGCGFLSKLLKKYSFDETVQMYNVGEAGYNIYNVRNYSYLEKVKVAYGIYS